MPEKLYTEKILVDAATGAVISSEIVEETVEVPTAEELIAEKEAELLKVYAEIESLKQSQNS